VKIIDCVQGDSTWWRERSGRPTASDFGRIITPATGKLAAGRDGYQAELIAESLGWRKTEFLGSPDLERGKIMEKEARRWLAMELGEDIREVGFCLSDCGRYGASPDGLLADGTPVEIKAPDIHTIIRWKMSGELPREHKAQAHGHMWVTGADRCIWVAYADHESLSNLLITVERDDFTEQLGAHLETFCDELAELKTRVIDDPAYEEAA